MVASYFDGACIAKQLTQETKIRSTKRSKPRSPTRPLALDCLAPFDHPPSNVSRIPCKICLASGFCTYCLACAQWSITRHRDGLLVALTDEIAEPEIARKNWRRQLWRCHELTIISRRKARCRSVMAFVAANALSGAAIEPAVSCR